MTCSLEVKIPESPPHGYPLVIGENLFPEIRNYLPQSSSRLFIISDENVADLYLADLTKNLPCPFTTFIIKAGEESKNLDNFGKICSAAVKADLSRKDTIIALGGGVIGDIAGFAAASYQRGINFIQIPTTLLAMVDSSIGGKVAVNLPDAKNMVGAFYQPHAVIADVNTLRTLPDKELKTGLAEVLKYAFLAKSCNTETAIDLLTFLESNQDKILTKDSQTMITLINACAVLKAAVVNQDEKETGLRAILNLGHTFAHALESLTGYRHYTHGEAVAIGIKGAFLLAADKGLISAEYKEKALNLLSSYGLTYTIPDDLSPEEIYAAMLHDKKASLGQLTLILPTAMAEVGIFPSVLPKEIKEVISKLKNPKNSSHNP